MVDALKHNYPESKIDFLAGKRAAGLLIDYPNINKVHTIEKDTISGIKSITLEGKYELAIVVYPQFRQ